MKASGGDQLMLQIPTVFSIQPHIVSVVRDVSMDESECTCFIPSSFHEKLECDIAPLKRTPGQFTVMTTEDKF